MQNRRLQFQTIGAVSPGRGYYIERPADALIGHPDTYRRVRYMLCPTQAGKTSYIKRAMATLRRQGAQYALINCLDCQFEENPGQAFGGFIASIAEQFELGDGAQLTKQYLSRNERPEVALSQFLVQEVAARVPGPVYIFVDELNAFLTNRMWLEMLQALAGAWRALREGPKKFFFHLAAIDLQGKFEPALQSLFGEDTAPLDLADFSRAETNGFLPALDPAYHGAKAQQLLDCLHDYVSGHPGWTQMLLKNLIATANESSQNRPSINVETAIQSLLLSGFNEPVLSHLENYISSGLRDPLVNKDLRAALVEYKRLHGGPIAVRSRHEFSPSAIMLVHLGLARISPSKDGLLLCQVRNRIVGQVFDPAHIQQLMAEGR